MLAILSFFIFFHFESEVFILNLFKKGQCVFVLLYLLDDSFRLFACFKTGFNKDLILGIKKNPRGQYATRIVRYMKRIGL